MNGSLFYKTFILVIILLNVFIKFYGIGEHSLWLDEAYSVNEAQLSAETIIYNSSQSDNPPVYYLLLHFWTSLFGNSEIGVRSLSAVSSILAACFIFIFATRNLNLNTGIISSLFFSFSGENLFYAQETRTYALVVLLTVLSIGLFFEIVRNKNRFLLVCFTLTNILLIYSHYLAACIPFLQTAFAIFLYKRNRRASVEIIISSIIVFLSFLPWIQYPLSHAPKEGTFWLGKPNFSNFKGVFISIAGNKFSLIVCFIVLIFAFFKKLRSYQGISKFLTYEEIILLTLTFFPIVIYYFIAGITPVFLIRYLLFVSVPFYILISYFLVKYATNNRILIMTSSVLLFSTFLSIELHPSKQENWRDAVLFLKKIKTENDIVFLSASYTSKVFSYYYDKNIFMQEDMNSSLKEKGIYPIGKLKAEELPGFPIKKNIIAVFCHELNEDPENSVKTVLDQHFKKINSQYFEKVRVIQYKN